MQVTPAILAPTFDDVLVLVSKVEYAASLLQIDLCDGEFGIVKTWLPEVGEQLPMGYEYEFDIMVHDWKTYVKRAIDMGASRIVVHVDYFTEGDATEFLTYIEHTGIALGVCVSNNIELDDHINFIKFFEERYENVFIQVMGIRNIGAQGQPFDEEVLHRITELKNWCPNLYLQVDGAMNNVTGKRVQEAGADIIISGSYVFGGKSVGVAIQTLEEI